MKGLSGSYGKSVWEYSPTFYGFCFVPVFSLHMQLTTGRPTLQKLSHWNGIYVSFFPPNMLFPPTVPPCSISWSQGLFFVVVIWVRLCVCMCVFLNITCSDCTPLPGCMFSGLDNPLAGSSPRMTASPTLSIPWLPGSSLCRVEATWAFPHLAC